MLISLFVAFVFTPWLSNVLQGPRYRAQLADRRRIMPTTMTAACS
jgi:multidrug efflux pump subunit AcrB